MKELLRRLRDAYMTFSQRLPVLREATLYSDDFFLVSYPKAGSNWLRFLIGNLVDSNDPVTFANVEKRIPSIYVSSNRQMQLVPRPRCIKSHEPFHPRYRDVVYIVRDPRDIAVSYYHFSLKLRKMPQDTPIDSFVLDFVADNLPNPCGTWAEHVMGWLAMGPSRKRFLFLRYEDLIEDTLRELLKVAVFLDIPADKERLNRAVELSGADQMRRSEKQWNMWDAKRGTHSSIPFVRAARSGQWSEVLSKDSVIAIEAAWGPVMQALGYKLVNDPAELASKSDSWRLWDAEIRMLEGAGNKSVSLTSTRSECSLPTGSR